MTFCPEKEKKKNAKPAVKACLLWADSLAMTILHCAVIKKEDSNLRR